jgi:hypothetical protein
MTDTELTITIGPSTEPAFRFVMEGDGEEAWPIALRAIADATGASIDAAEVFLDSPLAPLFGNEVMKNVYLDHYSGKTKDLEQCIARAVACWMEERIDRPTSERYALTEGIPFLTAWVGYYAAQAQAAA